MSLQCEVIAPARDIPVMKTPAIFSLSFAIHPSDAHP